MTIIDFFSKVKTYISYMQCRRCVLRLALVLCAHHTQRARGRWGWFRGDVGRPRGRGSAARGGPLARSRHQVGQAPAALGARAALRAHHLRTTRALAQHYPHYRTTRTLGLSSLKYCTNTVHWEIYLKLISFVHFNDIF